MLILSASDLRKALPMPEAIEAAEAAYSVYSRGESTTPLRTPVYAERGTTLVMPGHVGADGVTGIKVVSVYPENPGRQLPAVLGAMLLVDAEDGRPLALMDAGELTALRTGASAAAAAKHLARADSATVAIIGAGAQAVTQLLGLDALFGLEEIRVYDVNRAQIERYMEEMSPRMQGSPEWIAAESPKQAVRGADLVACSTTSEQPVFAGEHLAAGTHVAGVGSYTPAMREMDETTFLRAARVVVDSREACWAEAGDLIQPMESGRFGRDIVDAEIGEIINQEEAGRGDPGDITVFKAVGLAVLDVIAADRAYRRAKAMKLGTEVDLTL